MSTEKWRRLEELQTLRECPFSSKLPVVGPLIAWLRHQWNQIAARWYVLQLVEQQNAFNKALVELLQEHVSAERRRLVDWQQEQLDLSLAVAEVKYEVGRLRHRIEVLEQVVGIDPEAPDGH